MSTISHLKSLPFASTHPWWYFYCSIFRSCFLFQVGISVQSSNWEQCVICAMTFFPSKSKQQSVKFDELKEQYVCASSACHRKPQLVFLHIRTQVPVDEECLSKKKRKLSERSLITSVVFFQQTIGLHISLKYGDALIVQSCFG